MNFFIESRRADMGEKVGGDVDMWAMGKLQKER